MRLTRTTATFVLIFATMIWGMGFLAQKSAMDSMGPMTFLAARYLMGGLLILPFGLMEHRRQPTPITPAQWRLVALLVFAFFTGSALQQIGIVSTTVTNSGFLTGLYVLFVPLVLMVGVRHRPHLVVWICVPLALLGLYLLNGARLDAFNTGDLLVMSSAFFWAIHVIVLGHFAAATGRPVFVSTVVFTLAGLISLACALAFETVSFSALADGWESIVYSGLVATAIGFTLQAIGQRHVPPANAAIILSGEALFAALGGAVVYGERLELIGYAGIALIFVAILLVELIPALGRKPAVP